jgi:hypothetical protein
MLAVTGWPLAVAHRDDSATTLESAASASAAAAPQRGRPTSLKSWSVPFPPALGGGGRHRRRPVLVSGVHANFHTRVPAQVASAALTCEECARREFYLATQVYDASFATS